VIGIFLPPINVASFTLGLPANYVPICLASLRSTIRYASNYAPIVPLG
jgi:hypothetical protein